MHIMTQTETFPTNTLQDIIASVDPGIVARPLAMHWGTLVTLERQGQYAGWRLFFYNDGTSRLHHPKSASLPEVDVRRGPVDQPTLAEYLVHFIERGWI